MPSREREGERKEKEREGERKGEGEERFECVVFTRIEIN